MRHLSFIERPIYLDKCTVNHLLLEIRYEELPLIRVVIRHDSDRHF